jgi:hypothetical protein
MRLASQSIMPIAHTADLFKQLNTYITSQQTNYLYTKHAYTLNYAQIWTTNFAQPMAAQR